MFSDESLYHELMCYTLAHPSPAFPHQYVVDAHCAQHATEATKPVAITFALAGLCLHLEHHFTGREVQRAHMRMAQHRRQWLSPALPAERGAMTVEHVLAAEPGGERDAAIDRWCGSVWRAWRHAHAEIADLLRQELGL